ncbi:MAG: B12-binding domain-containing radical SAM protein [Thermodesulfobacteriota bacterium]
MKVFLVSANTEQINMPVMPLGLACVQQAVENAGHATRALNLMTRENVGKHLESAVADFQPDVIGISVRNIDDQSMRQTRFLLPAVKEIVDSCRRLSRAPIVLGGAGYSIFPRSALAYLGADMGIQGEGEDAFVELLNRIEHRADIDGIPGLFTGKTEAPPVHPGSRPGWERHPLPSPANGLNLHPDFKPETIWLPFQTRRGCPMNCSYCSTAAIEGRRLRKRPLESVITVLRQYAEAGFEQFFITDNTFNFPLSYAKAFCREILKSRLDIRWQAILYPFGVDDELADLMARSGCVQVSLGFESGSAAVLRAMNKRFTPSMVTEVSRLFKDRGIRRMGFLLLGGPGETRATVMESLAFAEHLQPEMMRFTAGIRIYPHTELEKIARTEGLLGPEEDLLAPRFYLEKSLSEWLPQTAAEWAESHPGWIFS